MATDAFALNYLRGYSEALLLPYSSCSQTSRTNSRT